MARGSMKVGSAAWKARELQVLAARLSRLEDPEIELENFLLTIDPKIRTMSRNYLLELMAVKASS